MLTRLLPSRKVSCEVLVGHEFSVRSDVNSRSCVPIPNANYTFIILFFLNVTALRLLSFMYALNMEVLYKMNSEQNKMVACNAAR
jgi:hypothetical protein